MIVNKIQNFNSDPLITNQKLYIDKSDYLEWKDNLFEYIQNNPTNIIQSELPISKFAKIIPNVIGYGNTPQLLFNKIYKRYHNRFYSYQDIYRNKNAFISTILYCPGIIIYHVYYRNNLSYLLCWSDEYKQYMTRKHYL